MYVTYVYTYKCFLSSSNLDAHKRIIIWLHQPLAWIEKELVGLVSKQFFFNEMFIEKLEVKHVPGIADQNAWYDMCVICPYRQIAVCIQSCRVENKYWWLNTSFCKHCTYCTNRGSISVFNHHCVCCEALKSGQVAT